MGGCPWVALRSRLHIQCIRDGASGWVGVCNPAPPGVARGARLCAFRDFCDFCKIRRGGRGASQPAGTSSWPGDRSRRAGSGSFGRFGGRGVVETTGGYENIGRSEYMGLGGREVEKIAGVMKLGRSEYMGLGGWELCK